MMTYPLPPTPHETGDPYRSAAQDRDAEAQREYDQLRKAAEHVEAARAALDEAIRELEQAHRIADELGYWQIASAAQRLALSVETLDVDAVIDLIEDEAPR